MNVPENFSKIIVYTSQENVSFKIQRFLFKKTEVSRSTLKPLLSRLFLCTSNLYIFFMTSLKKEEPEPILCQRKCNIDGNYGTGYQGE